MHVWCYLKYSWINWRKDIFAFVFSIINSSAQFGSSWVIAKVKCSVFNCNSIFYVYIWINSYFVCCGCYYQLLLKFKILFRMTIDFGVRWSQSWRCCDNFIFRSVWVIHCASLAGTANLNSWISPQCLGTPSYASKLAPDGSILRPPSSINSYAYS